MESDVQKKKGASKGAASKGADVISLEEKKKAAADAKAKAEEAKAEKARAAADAKAAKKSTDKPEAVATPKDPFALPNGCRVHMPTVRAALAVYAPDSEIPSDDLEALALLRTELDLALKKIDPSDHVVCGDMDNELDGCRSISTDAVNTCPFCGDIPPAAAAQVVTASGEALTTTDAGIEAQRQELAEAVAKFRVLSRSAAENAFDLGVVLRDIRERELWKAAGAGSLKEFMEGSLGISRTTGQRYMAISEEYDRETFVEIGVKKLELIMGIDSREDRDAALEAARAGASSRDIEKLANPGKAERDTAPAKEGKGSSAAPPKKGSEITLLTKVGSKAVVEQFRNADSGRKINAYKPGAYVEHWVSEDVCMRIAFKTNKAGDVIEGLSIAYVRAE